MAVQCVQKVRNQFYNKLVSKAIHQTEIVSISLTMLKSIQSIWSDERSFSLKRTILWDVMLFGLVGVH
jgi:hypothetical protein